MKSALALTAALVMAMPVISVPAVVDAQVLTGRSRATPARLPRPAPPRLTEVEQDQLWDAQSEIGTIGEQIAEVQALVTRLEARLNR